MIWEGQWRGRDSREERIGLVARWNSFFFFSLFFFACLSLLGPCLYFSKICLGDSRDMDAEGFEVDCSFGRLGILAHVCAWLAVILIRFLKYLKCRHVSRSRKEEKLRLKYALLAEQVFYKRAWYGWSMTTGQPMGRQDMGGQACFVIAPAAFTDRFTNVGLHLLQNCFRCSKILKMLTNNCKGWHKYFW